ncbi:glutamine--fructose-6-phosphate transaminase (isomerizing) [Acetobacteroides hydrogenigenes]|uniref:Glutamine--fructose-6-phosphate aminotransferase [isomerizing] n=1 Tax=Acetobacteroides hydrogenigenes TaxID=979970 RepID=A0A4R2E9X7_9BACT|nr:glutamine--fructose-6-phosphate transaminase (isomerizing) [Acetobacteroides hydrogenigenes]TCN64567.1 glucosamine--fructose-6-phosphate aminotransferase (isomerizing) [Acetobacteroides hydrogenigenes]
MCGIVAYVGVRDAYSVIIKGLKRLEYRGYDSAGIALVNGGINIIKKKGKVINLEEFASNTNLDGHIGIGHTRWATHGIPSDANSHPHTSGDGRIALVHNGIIENYLTLKADLLKKGHVFKSETDTEVLVHFIEDIRNELRCNLEEAVRVALSRVVGAFAIAVISVDEPAVMVAARRGSPLAVGIGDGEYVIASDVTPIIEYTQSVIYPKDNEMVVINGTNYKLIDLENNLLEPYVKELDFELASIEKGGFEHFMLKEIMEQPRTFRDCLRGRLKAEEAYIKLGGIRDYIDEIISAKRILIIACGTSYHAGLVAKYLFEDLCGIPTDIDFASEFRYRKVVITERTVVLGISQSGETADTIVALEKAKKKGAKVLGICNVVGSSIARLTDAGVYTHVGVEIGVASTKAFTGQLAIIYMMALLIAKEKGSLEYEKYRHLVEEFDQIPDKIEQTLKNTYTAVEQISAACRTASSMIYLGRGLNYPIALEGALKLKEITYIHAEGYPAAEMKHGPIALIDENMFVVFIAPKDKTYEKIVSNIQEVKSRGGKVVALVTEGDKTIAKMADYTIEIPETDKIFTPVLNIIPLQMLSYQVAKLRECNIDQPRNLAKSVTVE